MPSLHQMLGNLFYRGQHIETLNKSKFSELKYWNNWHEVIEQNIRETTAEIERKARG